MENPSTFKGPQSTRLAKIKETREGLEAIRERQYSSPLNEMYYNEGGIVGLLKK